MDVINVNFSSSTTPELLMKTFDHYCEYRRTPNGVLLAPVQLGRWLVIFCDEINLPMPDKYGTQVTRALSEQSHILSDERCSVSSPSFDSSSRRYTHRKLAK